MSLTVYPCYSSPQAPQTRSAAMKDQMNRFKQGSETYFGDRVRPSKVAFGSAVVCAPLTAYPYLPLIMHHKPDQPLGRIGRGDELAQGVEDLLELDAGVAA